MSLWAFWRSSPDLSSLPEGAGSRRVRIRLDDQWRTKGGLVAGLIEYDLSKTPLTAVQVGALQLHDTSVVCDHLPVGSLGLISQSCLPFKQRLFPFQVPEQAPAQGSTFGLPTNVTGNTQPQSHNGLASDQHSPP